MQSVSPPVDWFRSVSVTGTTCVCMFFVVYLVSCTVGYGQLKATFKHHPSLMAKSELEQVK